MPVQRMLSAISRNSLTIYIARASPLLLIGYCSYVRKSWNWSTVEGRKMIMVYHPHETLIQPLLRSPRHVATCIIHAASAQDCGFRKRNAILLRLHEYSVREVSFDLCCLSIACNVFALLKLIRLDTLYRLISDKVVILPNRLFILYFLRASNTILRLCKLQTIDISASSFSACRTHTRNTEHGISLRDRIWIPDTYHK